MTTERERQIIDDHLDADKQRRQRLCLYCGDPIEHHNRRIFCDGDCRENYEDEQERAEND